MNKTYSAEKQVGVILAKYASRDITLVEAASLIQERLDVLKLNIAKAALRRAAEDCSNEADGTYVGSNPIREGLKRGFRQSAIKLLSLADNLKDVSEL